MRVLVTRPQPQADAWVAALRAEGFEATALPLITIAPPAAPGPLAHAWSGLRELDLLIFVSPAAVDGFFSARPADASWPAITRVAAPGPGTGQSLQRQGVPGSLILEPDRDAPQFDSESLWPAIAALRGEQPDSWAGRQVRIVCGGDEAGARGRPWLAQRLRAAGAEVQTLVAYRRLPPALTDVQAPLRAALEDPAHHLWLFSSSESLDNLHALAAATGRPATGPAARALVTHPRIAEHAHALGWHQVTGSRPLLADVAQTLHALLDRPTPSIQSPAP